VIDFPRNVMEFYERFATEEDCEDYLFADLYLCDNSGGGDCEDGERFCESCEVPLDVWFSECAIEVLVLEVFKQKDCQPLDNPGNAWAMLRVLESLEWSDNEELVDAACVICEAILKAREREENEANTGKRT